MADVSIQDSCLWIKHVRCDVTQRALGALEPGARIWLSIDDVPLLFERMQDGKDGRASAGLKPVDQSRQVWQARYAAEKGVVASLDFARRPSLPAPHTDLL